jgi:hypothetical protein
MDIGTRASLIAIRLAALVVMIASVAALWNFMLWLPWQVDCVLAMAASFAYAYKFEREERQ